MVTNNGFISETKQTSGINHLLEHVLFSAWKKCNDKPCREWFHFEGLKGNATTDDILRVIGREELSSSQNNKRKADAIVEINKLMKQLVGKTIIKTRKDPNDKRQLIYYYKRNLLN